MSRTLYCHHCIGITTFQPVHEELKNCLLNWMQVNQQHAKRPSKASLLSSPPTTVIYYYHSARKLILIWRPNAEST